MKRILLVEDDSSLGETLCERLEMEGYQVDWSQSLKNAKERADQASYDLFIIDLGLPDGVGFDFAQRVRATSSSPFIFMTALNTAENRLAGYELGAEEFIPKPFHLKELLLRVQHVLKEHAPPQLVEVEGVLLDLDGGYIQHPGKDRVFLSERDTQLLRLLIRRAPQVVSRDEILSLWVGESSFPTNRTVDNAVVRIRQALGDRAGEWVRSVRGAGYQWLAGKR